MSDDLQAVAVALVLAYRAKCATAGCTVTFQPPIISAPDEQTAYETAAWLHSMLDGEVVRKKSAALTNILHVVSTDGWNRTLAIVLWPTGGSD